MDACKPLRGTPTVGLAYSAAVRNFIARHPGEVDHVEIPFELLRHDPAVMEIGEKLPIILHCASLSIAGTARCRDVTIRQIDAFARRTQTPWIGEHLAFISANVSEAGPHPEEYAPGEPYNIGYTVSPVMNARTVARVAHALTDYGRSFPVPLLIENSPLYFEAPGSTMAQSEFITSICRETNVGLLLDLAHFVITARRADFDPFAELDRLPLDRVVEVHISGVDEQDDGSWVDHARPAPEIVHRLLERVLERAAPRAITLEYNWSSRFPEALLMDELGRVRARCGTSS
jgi:uncharacterized protein (UPF0276 family)